MAHANPVMWSATVATPNAPSVFAARVSRLTVAVIVSMSATSDMNGPLLIRAVGEPGRFRQLLADRNQLFERRGGVDLQIAKAPIEKAGEVGRAHHFGLDERVQCRQGIVEVRHR